MIHKEKLNSFNEKLDGALFIDDLHTKLYATDGSVYRKIPAGVAYPQNVTDIQKIISFSYENDIPIIPRTAGTSLAGQCVGDGLIVDVSKHFTKILEVNPEKKYVIVEPGVIRDELNTYLAPTGLFFGPNTSTSNRCMLGGMVGNNSSGTTSIKYGVTRDKILELHGILSDGTEVIFKPLTKQEFQEKLQLHNLEGNIYRFLQDKLSNVEIKNQIINNFPKQEIHRRNTGYAIDSLLHNEIFNHESSEKINVCKLLAGSEGTLVFTTKIKLALDNLPPTYSVMIAAHFKTVLDACKAVVPVMQHNLFTCEMMDKVILDCTKNNKLYAQNRFFIEGDPQAILMLELRHDDETKLEQQRIALLKTLEDSHISYANPSLYGDEIHQALELRKAGLGLLGNMVGDKKAVACIEDTAVAIEDLSAYIEEFSALMQKYNQQAVYYAHAGAGELHLRPILDLKRSEDVKLFRQITTDVAYLVKKYHGCMSGEHGDGIVRSEFVKLMLGDANYELLKELKNIFDPKRILNPGKIIDSFPMDESLRYTPNRSEPEIATFLDFSDSEGILRATEKCNGSGDCRKTHLSSGTMCPSYHATKNEKDTTRGRANVMREVLTNNTAINKFDSKELKEALALCLSCKACGTECPSNVDMTTLKAEFLYQYHKTNKASLRDKAFAYNTKLNALSSKFSGLSNTLFTNSFTSGIAKKTLGIAQKRSLPKVQRFNFKTFLQSLNPVVNPQKKVILYIDEFCEFLDVNIAKDAIVVLHRLGYAIKLFYGESGRTFLSKGFLEQAKKLADDNIAALKEKIKYNTPVIGLEPSAILSFRDEYLRMAEDKSTAEQLSKNAFLIEEFIAKEIENKNITPDQFTRETKEIKFHAHCHQKALSNQKVSFDVLNLPVNYKVTIINSGCCGMAGSFGYEKEHYEVSMKIGETRLFPAIRKANDEVIIAANGTSCRHQIKDGTGKIAKHPITILKEALL
ncbi:FAD-binding and (Fe-S)-binding domain-containing protein [Zhouia sp. PK063]|uniref:FAD-binding and (Fe-S)-binding domain-containing protein n=1 Tax=Zhouia sp. PK063 TaxID=3373602 RepID=UPI00379681B9